MKTSFKMLNMLATSMMILVVAAPAAEASVPALPSDVLAQVETAGGFDAPHALNTSGTQVKLDGSVVHYSYVLTRSGPRLKTTVVATLSPEKLKDLQAAIAELREGNLVNEDPSAPTGADFPSVTYQVSSGSSSFLIAERRSNAHSYILRKSSAVLVRDLLDALGQLARFSQPSEFVF